MQEDKAKAFELANKIASDFGDYSKFLANKTVEKIDEKIEEGAEKVKKNFEKFKNLGEARRTTEDEEKEYERKLNDLKNSVQKATAPLRRCVPS